MASSALSILSGVAAAAAGLAGDKTAKDGTVPGLDITSIISALLGKAGGSGMLAGIASAALKSGLLGSKLSGLADLAGSLVSVKAPAKTSTDTSPLASLASAIAGNGGKAAELTKIAGLASTLAKTAATDKEKTGLAGNLGKALKGAGVDLNIPGTSALKGLDKVLPADDTKGDLFKTILKNLV